MTHISCINIIKYGYERELIKTFYITYVEIIIHSFGHVCRWGGEEILIMVKVPLDHTCKIAENIRSNVEKHLFVLHETAIHCSLTLGVASHIIGNVVEDTITHADKRLYYGKKNGKNRVVSPFDAP